MGRRRLKLLRRWRRADSWVRVTIAVIAILCVAALVGYLRAPDEDSPVVGSNLLVFTLVNINIIFLCILAFVIGRNVVKLIFDRRRNILGSRLRMRLVLAFAGLALVTNVILFVFAGGLLSRAMEGWFSSQVEASVSGATDVAKRYYVFAKEVAARSSERIAAEFQEKMVLQSPDSWVAMLETVRSRDSLFSVRIMSAKREPLAVSENAAAVIETFQEPPLDSKAFEKALTGTVSVMVEEREASHFVRSYRPLSLGSTSGVLVVATRIDPELSSAISQVNDSFTDYEQLKLFKNPLKTGYLLTLGLITGVILFSAIWFGFYLAKQISIPIQQLGEGTRAVARGNYDFQLRQVGDDELGVLVQSFNRMISDLRASRSDAERRRLFIETILSNLAVGVIAVDSDRNVTSVNSAARQLFGVADEVTRALKEHEVPLSTVLTPDQVASLSPLLSILEVRGGDHETPSELELSVEVSGGERKVLCTAGRLRNGKGETLGGVLLFDDITELSKAQHMSVWREVATRIAHEIKNPLTPIQLSAQRLQKLCVDLQGSEALRDCAQTIVDNVRTIKSLADEFTKFARMPTLEFAEGNLNTLVADVVALYAGGNQGAVFQFIPEKHLPMAWMDREQIRRVLLNLIDNALAALEEHPPVGEPARVALRTTWNPTTKMVGFEVLDNGPGISTSERLRIFEPYFTTKKGGTGLGLAIVNTIVADHQGDIRVLDNRPHGARFVVEFPRDPRAVTQRRLFSGDRVSP